MHTCSYVETLLVRDSYLPCLWDANRGTEKSFDEIRGGSREDQQIFAFQMILGKKAVAKKVSEYEDDEALEADLRLADGQPILCNRKSDLPDENIKTANIVSAFDQNGADGKGKYLLGLRFPEDLVSHYYMAQDSFALTLEQFKEQMDYIVKIEDDDNASVPPYEHGCL